MAIVIELFNQKLPKYWFIISLYTLTICIILWIYNALVGNSELVLPYNSISKILYLMYNKFLPYIFLITLSNGIIGYNSNPQFIFLQKLLYHLLICPLYL